ncbi:MAG: integrase core domain-containing protein [bacterium]|nr:integrase core domain-containing protein [bacterium]
MEVLNKTKIILCKELLEARVPKTHIADRLEVDRDTVRLWNKGIDEFGLASFLDRYESAKKGLRIRRQVDPLIKTWVWEIREREMDCCGQKILYFLKKEHDISLSVPKIYEILSEKYKIKSKWKKNQVRGVVPKASKPREVIQMDTVDFGEVFAFTGIDIFTKEADVIVFPSLTSHDGLIYLETSMERRFGGHSDLIQTDGGSEFKDEFKSNVLRFTDRHRIARPYKKNEQSYIESFNRSLRKECLGWSKYKQNQVDELNRIVIKYLERYHYHRPHISLGMRPPLERY